MNQKKITSVDQITPEFLDNVLAYETDKWDLCKCSIRDYFRSLLMKVLTERDSFGGKRPFGNGGWFFDLTSALVDGGFINGKIGECGDIAEVDDDVLAEAIILRAAVRMCEPK